MLSLLSIINFSVELKEWKDFTTVYRRVRNTVHDNFHYLGDDNYDVTWRGIKFVFEKAPQQHNHSSPLKYNSDRFIMLLVLYVVQLNKELSHLKTSSNDSGRNNNNNTEVDLDHEIKEH